MAIVTMIKMMTKIKKIKQTNKGGDNDFVERQLVSLTSQGACAS